MLCVVVPTNNAQCAAKSHHAAGIFLATHAQSEDLIGRDI